MSRSAAIEVDPELASPGRARAFVEDALPTSFGESDICLLLTSEVVTNAVLHAGTRVTVRIVVTDEWARIEVTDGSPVRPLPRDYGPQGRTGRGLRMVDSLASAWGVDYGSGTKTVWFEVGERPARVVFGRHERSPDGPTVTVHLLQPPMHLLPATLEYGEAVLREMALMALTGSLAEQLPQGWRVPPLDIGPVLEALLTADEEGSTDVVDVDLPSDAAIAALDRLAIIGLGDELARDGRVLVPPPLPEVGLCRYWFLTEIATQASGGSPTPWTRPERGEPIPVDAPHAPVDVLDDASLATVVADDTNRIVYVSPAALDILGWDATLVGQRLTTIIPPELREQHLAGFARVVATGAPRLFGAPLPLPALRRDGTCVEIRLVLGVLASSGGRNVYTGELLLA
ncbi:MAG TPA: PAS domain S-box protein [Aquihabitans sp.]|jgi:PAS domain S-box-containing protein|nr:PAS domain S-box protein [Aquihabitans sp.]